MKLGDSNYIMVFMSTVSTTKPHVQFEDGLWQNHTNGSWMLRYSGQKQGHLEFKLENAVLESDNSFKIYYRDEETPFIYLGNSTQNRIIRQRTYKMGSNHSEEHLSMEFIVTPENVVN